jgi:hypothetical protein
MGGVAGTIVLVSTALVISGGADNVRVSHTVESCIASFSMASSFDAKAMA